MRKVERGWLTRGAIKDRITRILGLIEDGNIGLPHLVGTTHLDDAVSNPSWEPPTGASTTRVTNSFVTSRPARS